jgi:hypothetical protein
MRIPGFRFHNRNCGGGAEELGAAKMILISSGSKPKQLRHATRDFILCGFFNQCSI